MLFVTTHMLILVKCNRLKGFETKLTGMVEQQGQDANVFRALVKENENINKTKKVRDMAAIVSGFV